ncbi:MAG: c-type cytochrome [Bacillota bacterium]
MRKIIISVFLVLFTAFLVSVQTGCSQNNKKEMSNAELVKRGKYLVNFGGCNDCHSPKIMTDKGPVPDTTKLLSGFQAGTALMPIDTSAGNSRWVHTTMDLTVWVGPWGVSFPANLTPDGATGIGNWTPEIFISAMRTGKHMGMGRPILPPMPWPSLAGLEDEDLRAIFAYLKSLKPINNQVPNPIAPNMVGQVQNMSTK